MQTIVLSENAVAVLRLRTKGLRMPVTATRLQSYRELAEAGIMKPDGDDFRFTENGWARARNSSQPPKPIFAARSLACRNGSSSREQPGRHWSGT